MGLRTLDIAEFFTVTAWGALPRAEQLVADFPGLREPEATLNRLLEKLKRWSVG
jgi:hypothetical protein